MIFNDFGFLFLFLPAILSLYHIRGFRKWRRELVVLGSLVFYGISGVEHTIVLCINMVWVYALTCNRRIKINRFLAASAIALPIVSLGYYKYAGFIIGSIFGLKTYSSGNFSLFRDAVLPAGISFYTFQLISFVAERYKGRIADATAMDFAVYVSFFPKLMAGPIVRFQEISRSISELPAHCLTSSDMSSALSYISFGLACKVLIADSLGKYISPMIASPESLTTLASIYIVFAYSLEIYFDFYGYSLTAIGLGRLFGFYLPDNFRRPYEALNPKDFWRRWHVTLSYWLRDYAYIPLGGNKRYTRNIFVVFALCGLWHGAGWTFLAWGLYHALLVVIYSFLARKWNPLPKGLQLVVNFSLVSFGWLFFLFDFSGCSKFLTSMIGKGSGMQGADSVGMWILLMLAGAICFLFDFEKIAFKTVRTKGAAAVYSFGQAVLMFTILMFIDRSQSFVYFRF